MAIPIGPNNPNFLQRLDPLTVENLRQTGGTAAAQSTDKFERDEDKPLTASDRLQLANQSGVTQEQPKPKGTTTQPTASPTPQARGESAASAQARLEAARLAAYDDPDTVYQRVLEDVPESHLEAAEKVVESQLKQGASKMSQLKSGPEAEEAGRMEMRPARFHGTLEIAEDLEPMPLEFPAETQEQAREAAVQVEQENLLRD